MATKDFLVWCSSYEESVGQARRVSAESAQIAAEVWAENRDSRAVIFRIMDGDPVRVIVENTDSGDQLIFAVSGASRPTYYAKIMAP